MTKNGGVNASLLREFHESLDPRSRESLMAAADAIVEVKKRGGNIAVVTGSGPNIHEGVTTLIAELMDKGIVDGVTTSSAVIGHEMAGSLDVVKMCDATEVGMDEAFMPRGNVFEFTRMSESDLARIREEMVLDDALLERGKTAKGHFVLKAAGNMAYPMGLRNETIAEEILSIARTLGLPFETVAGWGCDRRTMLGAGAEKGLPVLVTIPQMIGGGAIGIAIGESISVGERSLRVAQMLGKADIIIESAVALTQEIHDGPFETYTGHGIWSHWKGMGTYSLKGKTLIRIDLDENLRKAQDIQKESKLIQEAIDKGLPKTKIAKIPFRMEMSAFARHEGSIPIIGDIGKIWPLIAATAAERLGVSLGFMSYSQETDEGRKMRDWIVENVGILDRAKIRARAGAYASLRTRPGEAR
jgi:hypothetical protein